MSLSRHVLIIIAIVLSVFFIGYILDSTAYINRVIVNNFKFSAELFSVLVSFSIFSITWYSYNKSKDNHALFMGAAFIIIGFLDLFHMLSYPFMPDFITPNSFQKPMIFWNDARNISALLFLASAFVYQDTLPGIINKAILFVSAIVLVFFYLYSGLFYPSISLFGSSRILQEIISSTIILYACYIYSKRKIDDIQDYLIYGFIIIVFSDLVYTSYEITGHLLKVEGFLFINLAMYKSSVELPYKKLGDAEKKLLNAMKEKYRNLFDNANDAIIITDAYGRVTAWNKSAVKIFGWEPGDAIGNNLPSLIVPENPENGFSQITKCSTPGGTTGMEMCLKGKKGKMIDANMTISPITEENNKTIGMSYIIRDITEQKKAENERNENERLKSENKVKSEFFTTISHELKTPLNSIVGFSEYLSREKQGSFSEEQQSCIDNIIKSSKHLLNLINDILDMSKIEAGKMELVFERFQVSNTINETIFLIKEKADKNNILIKKEFDPQLESMIADKQKFQQILLNLLSNAVKFSKKEGGIITITSEKEGNNAKFSISDTGIGIKEEDIAKLFEKFKQLDSGISRKYGGTGLGLAISKQLIELHGGTIQVKSKFGEGSTFMIALPIEH